MNTPMAFLNNLVRLALHNSQHYHIACILRQAAPSNPLNPTMEIFKLERGNSSLILTMTHSGRHLPPTLEHRLTAAAREIPDTDWHLPRLFQFSGGLDCTVIRANYNRLVIDLNRPPDDAPLYPGRVGGELCPEYLLSGEAVYYSGQEPDDAETNRRLRQYWNPFHETLRHEIRRIHDLHGFVVIIDCHSIASQSYPRAEGHAALNLATYGGKSCDAELQSRITATLEDSTFTHTINHQFTGGYITRHYGNPAEQVHSLQIECAQDSYMDDPENYNPELAQPMADLLKEIIQVTLHWTPGQQSLL